MLAARHQAAVAQPMKQCVHGAQAIERAELFLENALEISSAKSAYLIVRLRAGFDAGDKSISLFGRQLPAPPLSAATRQTIDTSAIVATHPFLNRTPRHAQRFRDLHSGATSLGQDDRLHPNPHSGAALRSSQPPQFVQSVTVFHVHPAPPFKSINTEDAQIEAWRNSAPINLGKGINHPDNPFTQMEGAIP